MALQNRMRFGLAAALVVGTLAAVTPVAMAQPPGGGQMPPEIAAKIKAWQKWRDNNKNLSNLSMMMMQVREIDKNPDTKLDKKQAGTMLSIIKTWQSKPVMSDDQAKQVAKQIGGMMNEKQLKKMQTIQPFGRRGGGGGAGGGGARPAGAGGGGRPSAASFPDPPKGGMNPFNPDSMPDSPMKPQMKKSMADFTSDLAKRK